MKNHNLFEVQCSHLTPHKQVPEGWRSNEVFYCFCETAKDAIELIERQELNELEIHQVVCRTRCGGRVLFDD